uniref:Gnk2-homologous domain-containing protein n=1 Tax=Kalanchoe fedtschenkoi TaxID=63787 RepID=A0A7N0T7C6_KALFE
MSCFRISTPLPLILTVFIQIAAAADYTAYVYKGCAQQSFPDPSDAYTATVTSLFNTLIPQSLNTSFASATAGQGPAAISGLYQCRGDLKPTDCHDCVARLPALSAKFCGKAVAARVQLAGCYSQYEVAGFKQVADTEFLYKVCGSGHKGAGSEFEGWREAVFGMVEKGVVENGGFYAGVYALGQCQGDLASDACGDCIRAALSDLKSGCGDAVNGQTYLLKCYVSYSYYANGVPSEADSETQAAPSGGRKGGAQRTVAIVVGGVAVLGFVIACLLFVKSVFKKKEKKQGGYYTYQ